MKTVTWPRIWVSLVALSCSIGIAQEAPEAPAPSDVRNLEIDDEYRIKSLGDPNLSPDAKWLAYTISTPDVEKNRSPYRIWMIATEGGEPAPMTSESLSSWGPKFSRDGKRLYFLSARDGGTTQVWFLDLVHGGEAQQLTDLSRGANSINFSPDEMHLVLVLKDLESDKDKTEKEKNQSSRNGTPWVIDRLQFKRDYTGYLDRRRNHLYVYPVESKKLTQITSGDFDDSEPAWSPDGNTIAFVSNRTEEPDGNENSDIWLVDADNTDQGKNLVRVTSNPGADSSPIWHPDGRSMAYVSVPDVKAGYFATNHLARLELGGGEPMLLTKELDRNVSNLKFSKDGKYLYFNLEDSGEEHIGRILMSEGKISRPVSGQLSASSYALGDDGTLVALINKANLPPEMFVVSAAGTRQLTHINADLFSDIRLGDTEEIHFKSHDGLDIEGFVTKPPSFNPAFRYPTVVLIHGGPVSQYSHEFLFEAHLLAASDYVVVRCNPRGSSGYGRDFAMGIYQGWGEKDHRDILAAVDHVIEMDYADPDRLGVGGYSYGGFLTNYLITQTNRFKAAVSGAGSALYVASYGHDMYQHWYESELGLPWKNRQLWERLSPFNYIENVTTPTLFACGEKDWNVPVQNSEQLYQALRRLGVPTRLVVYPGEHHGGWSYAHDRDFKERLLAWYDKYLK